MHHISCLRKKGKKYALTIDSLETPQSLEMTFSTRKSQRARTALPRKEAAPSAAKTRHSLRKPNSYCARLTADSSDGLASQLRARVGLGQAYTMEISAICKVDGNRK